MSFGGELQKNSHFGDYLVNTDEHVHNLTRNKKLQGKEVQIRVPVVAFCCTIK